MEVMQLPSSDQQYVERVPHAACADALRVGRKRVSHKLYGSLSIDDNRLNSFPWRKAIPSIFRNAKIDRGCYDRSIPLAGMR